ncbi:MAG TPA: tetratricopeptide repeat protein [Alphaproteobacteria bacterium]|nr:tetratricopeptide repeat protein [Alphaproteobacteria bacterium]
MTYPDDTVISAMLAHAIPFQVDNTKPENFTMLHRMHHIWTPDLRVVDHNGDELYRWDGFLPPAEFTARMLCGFAMAHLRLKRFEAAQALYVEVLRRFPSTHAAPEAQYYLGVARYRNDPEGDDLGDQWLQLRSLYPSSEYRLKQYFKEMA